MNNEIDSSIYSENFYLKNKKKIFKEFNLLIKTAKTVLSSKNSELILDSIEKEAQIEFENLLSRLPYVGGNRSPFTSFMIQSAETIALYKASKSLNLSRREIGELIYDIAENSAQSIPSLKKWLFRKAVFSKKMKNSWREWLKESQKREYPENWVGDFIDGEGKMFDYGFNFTECGWIKLIKNEGAEDIAPYACLCDFARMKAIGVGFKRTKTIANGAEICDFRFVKNFPTSSGWPPEALEESKKRTDKNVDSR
ncbi:MAG: L-2-amino-thiazoline-4-carboxylic acid hydrolase [Promethearchaeota archaeon]